MQAIDPRDLLKNWVRECPKCLEHLTSNIGVILNEAEVLSDDDVERVIVLLNDYHRTFCVG